MTMIRPNCACLVLVTALALWMPSVVLAVYPLSNDASPLAVCEATIRSAAIDLEGASRRGISACLVRGIECLVGPEGARAACCARAAGRCGGDLDGIGDASREFSRLVENRRCGTLPFDQLPSSDGLAYGGLASACSQAPRARANDQLSGLAACLAQTLVSRTACAIGTRELPRGAEALTCMGLESAFQEKTGADLRSCGASAPAPSPSPSPAPVTCQPGDQVVILTSIDKSYAAARIDLTYPGSVTLPGSGDQVDATRVVFTASDGLTALNDFASGGGDEDTLAAAVVSVTDHDPGTFTTVTFDCVPESIRPTATNFACQVVSASDAGGQLISDAHCAVEVQ